MRGLPDFVPAPNQAGRPGRYPAVRVRHGSAEHLPLPDASVDEFAGLLAASAWAAPQGRAGTADGWWAERGARRRAVRSAWRFRSRADLAAVLRLEFPPEVADPWLAAHPDRTGLSCGYVLFALGQQP